MNVPHDVHVVVISCDFLKNYEINFDRNPGKKGQNVSCSYYGEWNSHSWIVILLLRDFNVWNLIFSLSGLFVSQ